MSSRPQITIGLLWHSANSGNLGVGALTVSNLAILREAAESAGVSARFLVLGWLDAGSPIYVEAEDVEVVGLTGSAFRPQGALQRAIRSCDLVLDIGGGDSFADIYGWKRFAYFCLSKAYVLTARRPLVLCPQTIGPFEKPFNRFAARYLMARARMTFARDDLSFTYAKDLGVERLAEASDVAFRLPATPPLPGLSKSDKIRVGLNVSALLYYGGYNRSNMFGLTVNFEELIRSLLIEWSGRDELEIHLVPHVLPNDTEVEDDYALCRKLAAAHPGVIVAPGFPHPSAAKGYIAALDFFAGARMHACIAALSSGVPVAPLAYSRKFAGLFGSLGYHATIDLKTETTDAAYAKVLDALARRAELSVEAGHVRDRALQRLAGYKDFLVELLGEVKDSHVDASA